MRKDMPPYARNTTRRGFLEFMGLGAAALGLPAWAQTPALDPGKRPNIILMMLDDCSAKELSCYGNKEINTPHLDELARTGVMFKTAWATSICSPSRAVIMTGRYAFRTKWYHNKMRPAKGKKGYNLAKDNLVFSRALKQAGYATAVCGKWQLHGSSTEYGFDEACIHGAVNGQFDGPVEPKEGGRPGREARYWHPAIVKNGKQVKTTADDYGPDIYVDFLLDFARRQAIEDKPFLVYYPASLIHKTWDFDRKCVGYVAPPELDDNGNKTGRKGKPSLKANVEYVDYLIKRITKGLESFGIRDNTVLFFTSDNGTSGYGKAVMTMERGPRVPMIVNCPGIVERLGAVDALTDLSDILPTLAELARAKLPDGYVVDGKSFLPILRGRKKNVRDWIFSNYADKRHLRDQRWLLDGDDRFYDCGNRRDEKDYKEVTKSKAPEVVAARTRFEKILEGLPLPNRDAPYYRRFLNSRFRH